MSKSRSAPRFRPTHSKPFKKYLQEDLDLFTKRDGDFLSVVSLGLKSRVKRIIKGGRHNLLVRDLAGNNAVHIAAKQNDRELLQMVCETGIPPNLRKWEFNKVTPFMIAAKNGCLTSLQYFHKQLKVDISMHDSEGQNAVFYAVMGNSICCTEYLIKEARLSYKTANRKSGNSLLHVAALTGKHEIVKYCCETLKLDPHRYNFKGQNCLRMAVEAESLILTMYFHAKHGVNPFAADNFGESALTAAVHVPSRLKIFEYFSEVLPPDSLIHGDPLVTRSLDRPPLTAKQAAFLNGNKAALELIYRKTVVDSRVALLWLLEKARVFQVATDMKQTIARLV